MFMLIYFLFFKRSDQSVFEIFALQDLRTANYQLVEINQEQERVFLKQYEKTEVNFFCLLFTVAL